MNKRERIDAEMKPGAGKSLRGKKNRSLILKVLKSGTLLLIKI